MANRFVEWDECEVPKCDVDLSRAGGNNQVTGTGTVGDDQVDLRLRGSADNYNGREGDDFIIGNGDNNKLLGSDGCDTLFGMGGGDKIKGGNDKDLIYGDDGHG